MEHKDLQEGRIRPEHSVEIISDTKTVPAPELDPAEAKLRIDFHGHPERMTARELFDIDAL